MPKSSMSYEVAKAITESYLSGLTKDDAAQRHGYATRRACTTALSITGTPSRTNWETRGTYQFDENYFDEIDTENKAYWLGFLTADGCVSTGNRLNLSLALVDKNHLDKFRRDISAEHPVKTYGCSASFTICNPYLVSSLAKYNIVPRKTGNTVPFHVCDALERHYWRGVFDGDGCIMRRRDYNGLALSLVGDKLVLEAFSRFAKKHCETKTSIKWGSRIYVYRVSGSISPLRLANALYENATIYLDRKYDMYRGIVSSLS